MAYCLVSVLLGCCVHVLVKLVLSWKPQAHEKSQHVEIIWSSKQQTRLTSGRETTLNRAAGSAWHYGIVVWMTSPMNAGGTIDDFIHGPHCRRHIGGREHYNLKQNNSINHQIGNFKAGMPTWFLDANYQLEINSTPVVRRQKNSSTEQFLEIRNPDLSFITGLGAPQSVDRFSTFKIASATELIACFCLLCGRVVGPT